jgi:hypothetical protein
MTNKNKLILDFIEKGSLLLRKYYSDYVIIQLKSEGTLKLLDEIMDSSNKLPSEAVLMLLAAIKYCQKDINALIKLEKNDSFQEFIINNHDSIIEISINKKVQGNTLERGLPILEIFGKMLPDERIAIIELGASYGLIGSCLLNHDYLLKNDTFFQSGQKKPQNPKGIDFYLGIDLDPPEKDWLLACCADKEIALNLSNYINNNNQKNIGHVLKSSAFGFSTLSEINELTKSKYKIVVLTSFMLYQFNKEKQEFLINEIKEFTRKVDGHWIVQDVELSVNEKNHEYFTEWDGSRILKLKDDTCSNWEWI